MLTKLRLSENYDLWARQKRRGGTVALWPKSLQTWYDGTTEKTCSRATVLEFSRANMEHDN